MAIWVWTKRPARVVQSYGDGTYEVEYLGEEPTPSTRINRNDLDPMVREERLEYLSRPRLEPDFDAAGFQKRSPLRKFMDEWPLSRAEMIKLLGFSPPKVDRLVADSVVPLDVAVLMAIIFNVEIDPDVLPDAAKPRLEEALEAAREGARSVQRKSRK
jgi:hypothetical protein